MLKINMFSTADKVKGQGVGSAYLELVRMLKEHFPNEFAIKINSYAPADISHYHTINPSFYLSTFSKKRGRKIGYVHFIPETLEGSLKIPQPFKSIFYKYVIAFYKRMDHIVVVNPSFIPKLENYGIPEERITYIPNFVSKEEFYDVDDRTKRSLRVKHGYDPQRFTVLGSGQIQTRKGVLDFVKLARQNPNVQFIWTGGFSFGKITEGYADLEKIVKNPPSNLSFPGIIDRSKMVQYYNMADLFLLPSYNELFPMSVLEAFSTNTPVMLRDLDLYKSIIGGYYLPADNEDMMNNQLHELLLNPDKLADLKRETTIASERYSENHLAKVWYDFYNQQSKEG
ncbi:alpha-galactosylglucosyldiacylglycerol synthase [Lentilactobacillus sunkii]|jgi:1,2-diacylglycerol-3-alpha-glucose alpha-1,2-galactosyltransferase|uniref:Alpha-galactosylglucosyldiacylglycerol synthase n=1 Tax=Lentilactobacillus sunkii TaxID=481719 RepID=A0A1E7XA57_9LACO|nr:glycosyltransferase family 4 protein [Lentilactobacillus sunkii]OFA10017.1 alpha-galactosylglucosyldiacylglycerol synthase [Lentilactobacillus sunkii]